MELTSFVIEAAHRVLLEYSTDGSIRFTYLKRSCPVPTGLARIGQNVYLYILNQIHLIDRSTY
jgi:hypothetical protein